MEEKSYKKEYKKNYKKDNNKNFRSNNKFGFKKKKYENPLSDQERIWLSRIYKLDKQIDTYIKNKVRENRFVNVNKILMETDFFKKANDLYKEGNKEVIEISLKRTEHVQGLVDIKSFINK